MDNPVAEAGDLLPGNLGMARGEFDSLVEASPTTVSYRIRASWKMRSITKSSRVRDLM
jgi:hypothetical protein